LQIETHKLDFKDKAEAKVGSKDNMDHVAGAGRRQVAVLVTLLSYVSSSFCIILLHSSRPRVHVAE